MASIAEQLGIGEFLEDGVRLKRTARKSTYVPKNALSQIKSTPATSVRASTNGNLLKSKNVLKSVTVPPIVLNEVCSTIEVVPTERILKLQKAKKGFINNFNTNHSSPNPLNGGPVTRSRPSLVTPILASNKKSLMTSPTTENSNQKMKLRVREVKNDVPHHITSNIVDKKSPVVALDNLVRITTIPKVDLVPIKLKKSSRSSTSPKIGLFKNNLKKSAKLVVDKEINNSKDSSLVTLSRSSSQVNLQNNNVYKKSAKTVASEKYNSSDSPSILNPSSTPAQVSLISNDKKLKKTVSSEKEINNSKRSSFSSPQVSLIGNNHKVLAKTVPNNQESTNSRTSPQVSLICNNEVTSKPVADEKDCKNDCSDKVVSDVKPRLQRKRKLEQLENSTSEKVRVMDTSSVNENTKLASNEIEVIEQDHTTSTNLLSNLGCDISEDGKSCMKVVNNINAKNNQGSSTTNVSTVSEEQIKIEKEVEVETLDGTSSSLKNEKTDFSGILLPLPEILNDALSSETRSNKIETEKMQSPLTTEEEMVENISNSSLWAAQALKPSTSSKSSLLQHLPNIDVIDDVEFLSFETENDLHRFVKRHPSYTLDLRRRNGVLRTRGDPIKLTKTSDITKIKGWRNKVFESGDNMSILSRNSFGYPSFKSFSHKAWLAEKCAKDVRNFEDYKDNENTLEHMDLDIDVYEERFPDGFHGAQDDDYEYIKVSQSDELLSAPGEIKVETSNRENCSKSAFISDYLDDFLRNKSTLRTSLDVKNKTETSPSKRINTKVVWPTQAGSLSRELTKIKPPPFQIPLPVKKALEMNAIKSNKVICSLPQFGKPDSKESSPKLSNFLNSQSNKNCAKKLKSGDWSPNITLKHAIEAVSALVCPMNSSIRPEIKRKSYSPKLIIAEEQVDTKPGTTCEKQDILKVNNFAVSISRHAAEFAVKALILNRVGKVQNLEKPSQKILTSLIKPKESTVPSKFTLKKSPGVSESSPKLKVAQSEEEGRPPSPYPAELVVSSNGKETLSECLKPYCQLGCVCESLKVPKRKRGHCGKSSCLFACTCKVKKVEEDSLARQKRQIRLPARLKDSFLWNGGRDLPLNFDWDMTVHRKGEVRDEQTKVLWKDSAKWHSPVIQPKEAKKRAVHRVKPAVVKHLAGGWKKNFKSPPKMPMVNLGIKYPPRQSLPKFKETTLSSSANSSVEASRANLQKALSKQLLGYKPCVVNVKKVFNEKGGGAWKIVKKFEEKDAAYLRKVDEKRSAEPNQMLPHDWRFVSKPPELDPNCNEGKRQSWNKLKLRGSILPASAKRQDMRVQLKRLNYLIKPMMKELKEDNPGLKNTKTLLVDLAKQSIKRLYQNQLDLLHEKCDQMIKRRNLFQRFTLLIKGMSVDKQKTMARELARLLHSCCKGVVRNPKNQGGDGHTSQTSTARSQNNPDLELNLKENVSEAEFEDYLSDVNTSDEDSSDEDSDEPRVVIENDLEDECEPNNTLIDISSNNMGSVSKSTYFQRGPVISKTVSQAKPQTVTTFTNLSPSEGQWVKLTPPTLARTSFNYKISKETCGIGNKANAVKGIVEKVTKETFAKSNATTNIGKGIVDIPSAPQNPRKEYVSFKIPSSIFTNKRIINGEASDKLNTSSSFNLEELNKTTGVLLKDGLIQRFQKFPINCEKALPGTQILPSVANSTDQQYATILIPISMLSNKSPNNTMNLEKVDGPKPGGLVLRTIAPSPAPSSSSKVISGFNSAIASKDGFKRPAQPTQRFKLNDSSVVKKILEFTSVENKVQPIALTNVASLSESKVDSNHCSQTSKVAGEGTRLNNPVVDTKGYAEQTNNVLEDQCDNEDDSEVATEEMFKIVGFSSISEDEFRLKED